MDIDRFAEGYEIHPRKQEHMPDKVWDSVNKSIIDPSTKWSLVFSRIVTGYLNDTPSDPTKTMDAFKTYTNDRVANYLDSATKETERAALHASKLAKDLNAMHFHAMNQPMAVNWLNLIDADDRAPESYMSLLSMQAKLAIQAMRLVESRHEYLQEMLEMAPDFSKQDAYLDRSFAGRITEVDAAITLVELAKLRLDRYDEHLVPLPAPSTYEQYVGKASDFLLFDTVARQAIGIQVKTRLQPTSKYNRKYVSFIDGVEDLGNYRLIDYEETPGTYYKEVIPGLISADLILNNEAISSKGMLDYVGEFKGFYGQTLHAQDVAKTLAPHISYKYRAEKAARKIEPRLIEALHRNETEV